LRLRRRVSIFALSIPKWVPSYSLARTGLLRREYGMVDYSFPEGLLTPLAVNHFQVTGYTLSPAARVCAATRFCLSRFCLSRVCPSRVCPFSFLDSPQGWPLCCSLLY